MANLKEAWARVEDSVIGTEAYGDLIPPAPELMRLLAAAIREHVRGRVLDAGAGRLTHRFLLAPRADLYVSLDARPTHRELDVVADLLGPLPFRPSTFDAVVCSQVLEHVPEPGRALAGLAEVLRPGGRLVLSVPHLSYLHGLPHDYFRFTRHGIEHLVAQAGLQLVSLEPAAGLLAFVTTPVSMLGLIAACGAAPLRRPALALNRAFVRAVAALDCRLDREKLYAVNYVAVAVKPRA